MNEMQLGMTGLVDESSAPEAGKMLGVKILVIGSYASIKSGAKISLRFNCKVVDAKTGQLLGGGGVKSTGSLENIFNIEEEIAEIVVTRVGLALSGEEKRYFKVPATSSIAAYELYSQALLESNAQSKKRLMERALELDKNFARAHLALGYILYEMSAISGENKELVAHCTAALKKDPRLIEAHYIMASYYDRISRNEDDELIPDNAGKAIEQYGIYIEKSGNSPLPTAQKRVDRAEKRIKELKG
jgi:tetratricopeptide (TPR) repeat protein